MEQNQRELLTGRGLKMAKRAMVLGFLAQMTAGYLSIELGRHGKVFWGSFSVLAVSALFAIFSEIEGCDVDLTKWLIYNGLATGLGMILSKIIHSSSIESYHTSVTLSVMVIISLGIFFTYTLRDLNDFREAD